MSLLDLITSQFKPSTGGKTGNEVYSAPPDALASTLNRFQVYRDSYRVLIKVNLVVSAAVLGLIITVIIIILTSKPTDRFFVAAVDGRIETLTPLDESTEEEMPQRAAKAVMDAMSFGFLDYAERRDQMVADVKANRPIPPSALFRKEAHTSLMSALLGKGGVAEMESREAIYSATFDESRPFEIVRAGINADFIYEWVFQIPVLVEIKAGPEEVSQGITPWVVQILVQRSRYIELPRSYWITEVQGAQAVGPTQPAPKPAGGAAQ